jgi:hypothetical protein
MKQINTKKTIAKTVLLLAFIIFNSGNYFSQNFVWVKTFGGPTYDDWRATSIDAGGNVIAVGSFSGTVDFDPGVGVTNLTSIAGGDDIFVMKLTSAGALVWARRIGTTTDEGAYDVICDGANNVYVTGSYRGTVDFDPGAGTNNLASAGNQDCFLLKLNSFGNFVWARSMGGTLDDYGSAIEIDAASANLYLTGTYNGTADFNPSAAVNNLISYGAQDAWVGKYDVNGNYAWAVHLGGTAGDYGYDLKVGASNNYVYCIGNFAGTSVTLTPGCSCPTYSSQGGTNSDIYCVKLTCSGGGYNSLGLIGGPGSEFGVGITLDAAENIYMCGQFSMACDMDPGFGTVNLASAGSADGFVVKLSSTFVHQWSNKWGSTSSDACTELDIDPLGNLYITGNYNGTVDFDPGVGTYTLAANGANSDCYVMKLNNGGNFVWAKDWGATGLGDYASDIDIDAQGNVYSIGTFWSTVDFDPGAAVTNSTSIGQTDGYIHKLSCTLPATVATTLSNYTLCANTITTTPIVLTATLVEPGTTYGWSVVGATGVGFAPTTGTATTMSYTSSTTFSIIVTATNACGTTTTSVNKVTVNALPTLSTSASPTAVCSGSLLTLTASGANTYTWSNSVTNATPFIPSVSQTYTVLATNSNGCVGTKTINVGIVSNPVISVTGNNLVCLNKPNTLTGSGAVTYTWLPGSVIGSTINAQPTANTIYTVNATGANGCNNSSTFTLNLVFPQTPQICMVTVDSLGINNEIFWEKTLYANVDSFIVYRETSTNIYKRIAAISKNAYSGYTDTSRSVGPANGDPNSTSYKYKLQLRDSCGNYSTLSNWHQTIFIQDQQNGNFNWNSYAIESSVTPVSVYDLFRIDVATNNYSLVTSTTAGLATDPQYNLWQTTAKWRVQANGFNCNPTNKTNGMLSQKVKTKSNIKNDKLVGIKNYDLMNSLISTYPSPAKDVVFVDGRALANIDLEIEMQNTFGQTVFSKKYTASSTEKYQIETTTLANGVYFVNIKQQNKTIAVKKIVVNK